MTRYITLGIFTIVLFANTLYSNDNKTKLMIGQCLFSENTPEFLDDYKIEAALTLAAGLTKDYKVIGLTERDSVSSIIEESGKEPTALNIARELDVDKILFFNVQQLKNMVRIEMVSKKVKNNKESRGIGYSLLRFRHENDNKPLYDPTILIAVQRALAESENKPELFADLEGSFRVLPAKTTVVGGLMFLNDPNQKDWELFKSKEIISYDVAESIFEAAIESPTHVVYDTESRDSIYAMFNMFGIENFKAPTSYEIKALSDLEVQIYITGMFKRTPEGAEIELHYCDLSEGTLNMIRFVKGKIRNDLIDELRAEVKKLTRELLEIPAKKTSIESDQAEN